MLPSAQRAALVRAISPDRLGTYQAEAQRSGRDEIALYLWDRDMASAAMADIAIVEVAMRNTMNDALARLAGQDDWYAVDIGLDDRSLASITKAWGAVPPASRVPGRIVAQLMFGFWRMLLESGGDIGKGPMKRRASYETLWRQELRKAFPGGRAVAAAERLQFTRTWTLDTVKLVHALRNRAAHHEPLLNGIPIQGENRRITAKEGHAALLKLAEIIDRDLHTWFLTNSQLSQAISQAPA